MNATALQTYRRSEARVDVRWKALWSCQNAHGKKGSVLDLSSGGAFVRPDGPTAPVPGTSVQLRLITSRGEEFSMEAIVRWAGISAAHLCFGFGVSFVEPLPYLPVDQL
jgi:hypothetical protein